MEHRWKTTYSPDQIITVYWDNERVAWAQWSPLYQLWRVLICDTGQLHHVETEEKAYDVVKAYLGVDMVD